jgi:hypothetical protein
MDDHRHASFLTDRVRRIQLTRVRGKAAVHRMDLESNGTEIELPLDLSRHRMVQVRIHVRRDADPPRVEPSDGQHVLDRLNARDSRAVLGQQNRTVDAFAREEFREARRNR